MLNQVITEELPETIVAYSQSNISSISNIGEMSDGINATESFVKRGSSFVGNVVNLTERGFGLEGLKEHIAEDYIVCSSLK